MPSPTMSLISSSSSHARLILPLNSFQGMCPSIHFAANPDRLGPCYSPLLWWPDLYLQHSLTCVCLYKLALIYILGVAHWHSNDLDYNTVLKRSEIPTHATWMNVENIMLRETSQIPKDKYCIIPLTWGPQCSKIHKRQEVEGWSPGAGGGVRGVRD